MLEEQIQMEDGLLSETVTYETSADQSLTHFRRDEVISGLTQLIRQNEQFLASHHFQDLTEKPDLAEYGSALTRAQPILIAVVRFLESQNDVEQAILSHLAMCSVCHRHQPANKFDLEGIRPEYETCFWGKTPVCDTCLPAYRAEQERLHIIELTAPRIPRVRQYLHKRLTKTIRLNSWEARNQVIYKLTDPQTDKVRYVGHTHNLAERSLAHMQVGVSKVSEAKREWINELRARKLCPSATVIENVDPPELARAREFRWILQYLKLGTPLTNVEASYIHLVKACQSASVESFLTEPLDSPVWDELAEAYALDTREHWGERKRRARKKEPRHT